MNLNSLKKYAAKGIPLLDAGKSDAQRIKKALVREVSQSSHAPLDADRPLLDEHWKGITKLAGEGDRDAQKTVAHVAVKLLSSRAALQDPKVGDKGRELLQSLGGAGHDALNRVFGHYQHKSTFNKWAAGTFVAAAAATIGAFAGAGAAGLVPLIFGMVPSGTAWAKSRKAGHRLETLAKRVDQFGGHPDHPETGIDANTHSSYKDRKRQENAYKYGPRAAPSASPQPHMPADGVPQQDAVPAAAEAQQGGPGVQSGYPEGSQEAPAAEGHERPEPGMDRPAA